jgi:hypothetical protein
MNLVLLCNEHNFKQKFIILFIYSLLNDTTVAELQWVYSTEWQDECMYGKNMKSSVRQSSVLQAEIHTWNLFTTKLQCSEN